VLKIDLVQIRHINLDRNQKSESEANKIFGKNSEAKSKEKTKFEYLYLVFLIIYLKNINFCDCFFSAVLDKDKIRFHPTPTHQIQCDIFSPYPTPRSITQKKGGAKYFATVRALTQ